MTSVCSLKAIVGRPKLIANVSALQEVAGPPLPPIDGRLRVPPGVVMGLPKERVKVSSCRLGVRMHLSLLCGEVLPTEL